MATIQKLSVDEVREYVSDYAANNRLIDGEEFSDPFINLSINLAIDEFNSIPPMSMLDNTNFVSKSVLLWGTLWKMFEGKAMLYARNTMNYSDGGIQIPVEEKTEMYMAIARDCQASFMNQAKQIKVTMNMESGWGYVSSDGAYLPIF